MKNSQLCHIWAQQTKDRGQTGNGNFSFSGRSLYSYKTEIARFICGRVVRTSIGYSPTTRGKHANQIWRACGHLEVYTVDCAMKEIPQLPENFDLASDLIFDAMIKGIADALSELKRARSVIYKIDRLKAQIADAWTFYARFNPSTNSAQQIPIDDLYTLNRFTGTITQDQRPIGSDSFEDILLNKYGIDVREKIARNQLAIDAKTRADDLRRAERAKLQAHDLETWRADTNKRGSFYDLPIALRLNGATIETSHGAIVPVIEAIKFADDLAIGRDVRGRKIGEFIVTSADAEIVIVGCHKIPRAEIVALRAQIANSDYMEENADALISQFIKTI